MDGVRRRLEDVLPPYLGVLTAGLSMIRRRSALTSMELDPLAEWCADEGIGLLREDPPRVFEVYLCLEVAAAREPEVFGAGFRGYRDRVMRAVLGAARESGMMVNVPDTTVVGRWVGRNRSRVRAELRGYELRVHLEDGRVVVLDRDLGMSEGCDA
jgi:hypothetical protein